MLVDSGATHSFVDPLLAPRLQDTMSDCCALDVSHTIVAAGQHVLQGAATGTVQGTVIDDGERERNLLFQALECQEWVPTCSLSLEAMWKGVSTIGSPAQAQGAVRRHRSTDKPVRD